MSRLRAIVPVADTPGGGFGAQRLAPRRAARGARTTFDDRRSTTAAGDSLARTCRLRVRSDLQQAQELYGGRDPDEAQGQRRAAAPRQPRHHALSAMGPGWRRFRRQEELGDLPPARAVAGAWGRWPTSGGSAVARQTPARTALAAGACAGARYRDAPAKAMRFLGLEDPPCRAMRSARRGMAAALGAF